jgi:hypothetical protein
MAIFIGWPRRGFVKLTAKKSICISRSVGNAFESYTAHQFPSVGSDHKATMRSW